MPAPSQGQVGWLLPLCNATEDCAEEEEEQQLLLDSDSGSEYEELSVLEVHDVSSLCALDAMSAVAMHERKLLGPCGQDVNHHQLHIFDNPLPVKHFLHSLLWEGVCSSGFTGQAICHIFPVLIPC